jgi:hypothetical protein
MRMMASILATAAALCDRDLLARLVALAGNERDASVELVAHLAALDTRPAVYAAQGYGSLFSYCTQALRLSEDAACNRIEAARASRRFPLILDLLAAGSLSLTSVRILGRHLTPENHEAVLARAKGRSRREIDTLVAELAPQPDARTSVRRLPTPTPDPTLVPPSPEVFIPNATSSLFQQASVSALTPAPQRPTPRSVVQPTAPERYRVQFTVGHETHEKLRRVQTLLRREIPDGDPGAIFERALALLLERVEKTKLAVVAKLQPRRSIRPETDKLHKRTPPSRYIPREVKRAAWQRDGGQCAFVAPAGQRCRERTFLEFHHVRPFAQSGPATVANISLRCRRHNQYEADLIFGRHRASATLGNRDP